MMCKRYLCRLDVYYTGYNLFYLFVFKKYRVYSSKERLHIKQCLYIRIPGDSKIVLHKDQLHYPEMGFY